MAVKKSFRKCLYLFEILFIVIVFPKMCFSQTDTIHWSPNFKLQWNDFQGKPDSSSANAAFTFSAVSYKSYYINDTALHFDVFCFFDKLISWTKTNTDSILIRHEQGHFNITELFARKLRKAFKNLSNEDDVRPQIKRIFEKIMTQKKAMQILYDKETQSSKNRAAQIQWDKYVLTELENLKEYEN